MSKTILITGSDGFLGEELVNSLSETNKIIAIDKIDEIKFQNESNIKKFKINIQDHKSLESVFRTYRVDIIIHCAAEILDEKNPKEVWNSNYYATKNLLNLADSYNVNKFIFTSTFSIFEKNYESQIDEFELPSAKVDYGKSKYAAENLILRHSYNGDIIIFRCPVIIGKKRLDKIALLFEMIENETNVFLIGDGMNKIHFISSYDLIQAIKKSFEFKGKILFNIGSDDVKPLKKIFDHLIIFSKKRNKIITFPKLFGILFLKVLYLFKFISLGPYHQRMLTANLVLDTSRIKRKLDWKPTLTNEQVLIECYKYYIKNKDKKKETSSSKKIPRLTIIKILKMIKFLW